MAARSFDSCQAANLARNCGLRCRPDRVLHSACFIASFEIARIQTVAGTPNLAEISRFLRFRSGNFEQ
jgi:hypothetical protein